MAIHAPPPSLFTPTTVFSLLATVALLLAALFLAHALLPDRLYKDRTARWTFVWLVFDALIHFTLEGAFVWLSFPRPRTVNSANGPLASLWSEYALADTRWAVSDPTVVSVELITVLGAGPLCVWTAEMMRRGRGEWRVWTIMLSVAELYGGWMTFVPEWVSGSPSLNTSHWLYTYVYLLFFNGLWVVIPLVLIAQSFGVIKGALEREGVREELPSPFSASSPSSLVEPAPALVDDLKEPDRICETLSDGVGQLAQQAMSGLRMRGDPPLPSSSSASREYKLDAAGALVLSSDSDGEGDVEVERRLTASRRRRRGRRSAE
ncbi:hypothetical protein JCM8547_000072 [Rhodosporidiobolus lusitaniae]